MHNPFHPPPAPPAFAEGKVLPERNASILSRLVFRWLAPFLDVGFSRPLQLEDLWELPPDILTANLSSVVETNFYARCPPEKRPQGDTHSDLEEERTLDDKAQTEKQQYDSSLLKSLHHTYFTSFWLAGFMKLFADTLKTTTPLINKLLLSWLSAAYLYHHTGEGGEPSGNWIRDWIGICAVCDAGVFESVDKSLFDGDYENWAVAENIGKCASPIERIEPKGEGW